MCNFLLSFFLSSFFFFKIFIYFFERTGKGGNKRRRGTSVCNWSPPTRDLAHNPGMCPDWELNLQSSSLQAGAQSTEPHKPGLARSFCVIIESAVSFELLTKALICLHYIELGSIMKTGVKFGQNWHVKPDGKMVTTILLY